MSRLWASMEMARLQQWKSKMGPFRAATVWQATMPGCIRWAHILTAELARCAVLWLRLT
jgi:hypothetical protein